MKIFRLAMMTAASALILSAYSLTPKTDTTNPFMRITGVERTDSALRMNVTLFHLPGYWVKIPSTTRLISTDDSTLKYSITGAENIMLDQEIWMSASGKHEGVLIFEKVPENVKRVDFMESDNLNIRSDVLGIRLDEPDDRPTPEILSVADITNGIVAEEWEGLDPKRYEDFGFYNKEGSAHIKGKIVDYSPRYGISTFTVRVIDDLAQHEKNLLGNINPDGTFELDVPVTYPQLDFMRIGNAGNNIFLIPGDTLSIVSSFSSRIIPNRGICPDYFGYEGLANDATVINILKDSLIYKRYFPEPLYGKYVVENSDSMAEMTYEANERLAILLDSVIADLPLLLRNLPISVFAKDALSSIAIGEICQMMEDLELNFRHHKGPSLKTNEDGTSSYEKGEQLDYKRLIGPRLKHKELIYNNPLMLCNGLILLNRWNFSSLFYPSARAAEGLMKDEDIEFIYRPAEDVGALYTLEKNHLDSLGIGECVVAKIVRNNAFISGCHNVEIPDRKNLERRATLLSYLIRHNDCDKMNEILMNEYHGFVKDVLIAENELSAGADSSIILDNSENGEVLHHIIAPYKGNVLFLDFWSIGCGPCRGGMINQKNALEDLADQPFRALYIANREESMEACKKWLRNEGIKGEHIFVTNDDWNRLCNLFNINGIPHGVLIGKDGRVIENKYNFKSDDQLLIKALEE